MLEHTIINISPPPVPQQVGLPIYPDNPALPRRKSSDNHETHDRTSTHGTGPDRIYLESKRDNLSIAFPPRPVPGSIADLDIVMEHCAFVYRKVLV